MADPAKTGRPSTIRAAVKTMQAKRGRSRQFWRAFDRSPIPMVTVDSHQRYRAANAAARLVFRMSLEDWRSRRIEDLTPPHMFTTLGERWGHLVRHGSASGRYDCDLPDGSVTIVYCALANVLPGQHLIVFLPSTLPDNELVALLDDDAPPAEGSITPREQEVLTLIATGADLNQIADELAISVGTVRTHTRNLLPKLGARNRAHAIALAIQHDLIRVPPLELAGRASLD